MVEIRVVDTAEICQGAIHPRTMCGVPTTLFVCGVMVVAIVLMLGWIWAEWRMGLVLPPALVLYGWARWQTKKDPYWVETWWHHLQHPAVYEG